MTKERPGFHMMGLQLPDVVWSEICADAEAQRVSITRVVTEILRRHYRVPPEKIPAPRKTGRKPKK